MIYGLYLSSAGVLANSYRQDVIANNIANAETVGFKRDLATFQQRPTAAQELGLSPSQTNALMENLGGGLLARPTLVDTSPGEFESGNAQDVAIEGQGYFAVNADNVVRLTRDGRFFVDRSGNLAILSGNQSRPILSDKGAPIALDKTLPWSVERGGAVNQAGKIVARIGVFDVPDPAKFSKMGGNLLAYPDAQNLPPITDFALRPGFVERSNVDPATELTQLMDAQRQLEANANMIRYQDETLNLLVNNVGKIS